MFTNIYVYKKKQIQNRILINTITSITYVLYDFFILDLFFMLIHKYEYLNDIGFSSDFKHSSNLFPVVRVYASKICPEIMNRKS